MVIETKFKRDPQGMCHFFGKTSKPNKTTEVPPRQSMLIVTKSTLTHGHQGKRDPRQQKQINKLFTIKEGKGHKVITNAEKKLCSTKSSEPMLMD